MAIGVTCAAVLAATATLTGGPAGAPPAAAAPALTPFGSCAEVDAWLAQARRQEQRVGVARAASEDAAATAVGSTMSGTGGPQAAVPLSAGSATDAVGPGRTGTNTQERDVDEPDAAKSVDGVLYTTSGGRLHVVSVSGVRPVALGSVAVPALRNADASTQILLAGSRVVVLSTRVTFPPAPITSKPTPLPGSDGAEPTARPPSYEPVVTSTATVVDVSDPAAPKVVTAVNRGGWTVAARLSQGVIRWITSSSDRPTHLECTRIQRPQASSGAGIISVDTLDPAAAHGKDATGVLDSIGVASDGSMVYASVDRLYVATTPGGWAIPMPVVAGRSGAGGGEAPPDETIIHGFDVTGRDGTRYVASGRVEGRLLSQWSMSERGGHLRVATTRWLRPPTSPTKPMTEPISPPTSDRTAPAAPVPAPIPGPVPPQMPGTDAAVTVLAERGDALSVVGKVTGLGKGEQIKSVRWFDDLGVVVTFRQTDPLYVLDLTDPTRPQVKGELKIDGFSSYLHPIGNHRLLGVGNAANARTGQVTGAQVAVFDISDPARPARLSVLTQPNAWPRVGADARAFSFLPAVATALYGMDGPMPRASGGAASKPTFGSYLAGFAVRSTGRLVTTGTVPMPLDGDVRQVAVDGTRVAIVASAWGSDSSGRVSLVDASGPQVTQTGTLSLVAR